MLAIQPPTTTTPPRTTPNILPCAIKHNASITPQPRHWSPTRDETSDTKTSTAYFRGRKLLGRSVEIPEGYQGVVLQKTDDVLPAKAPTAEQLRRLEEDDDEVELQQPAQIKMMQTLATFDEIVVWGHEAVAEDEDEYVKCVREWMGLAAKMHSYDTPASEVKGA